MIVNINGSLKPYYAQTLCLLLFPGATFGENEERSHDNPEITFTVEEYEDRAEAEVSIKIGENVKTVRSVALAESFFNKDRLINIAAGQAFFKAGKEMLGYAPPWGIHTGIRPAKLAMDCLKRGSGILAAKRVFREEYLTNPKKAGLAVSIASKELKLTKKLPPNLCSLYISIPFCPTRCAYCSFVSASDKLLRLLGPYLEALKSDIGNMVGIINELGLKIATVYIGGGTPTVLNEQQLEELMCTIDKHIDVSSLMEFTVECGRPDTINEEKLSLLKAHGVTRISVNPQVLDDKILEGIGRHHTVEDFYRAYDMAVRSGIKDINVDLIAGLPGDTYKNFYRTVDKILELSPSNLTVHTFSVKKAAAVRKKGSTVYTPSNDSAAKSVDYALIKTKLAGYKPYYIYRQKNTVGNLENVGYSKDGSECFYNIFMMEELHSVFAVGAGAVTKLVKGASYREKCSPKIERIFSPKYPYEYLRHTSDERFFANIDGKPSMRENIMSFFADGGEQ